ncbi:Eco57I restriction-modification methylase domain-containing protein [Dolichospermum circinale]|uniref:Eco57I restriction-modification methylase domain-containing protein n=1 Tax=Dolichospermum circinale TaxID=109265 RepID=UPI00232FF0FF|nr:TaqI-like C-terminal specificity domain-containing protein [Dolichospermum circinale]MDB9468019.1 TaqI-like C-terminal specificity domain-containing protein [Dolichospermum circinale CS-539/09]MDB9470682.1 TaqI-like C-terminal specificity domain-containing protein [Dolichospermum circinale CS-539]
MTNTKNTNKPLFSQHYLDYRIQELPEWQLDLKAEFADLKNLYLSKKAILATLNEAQTEDIFIKPALEILGFKYIPQVISRGQGRAERPDYALFLNESERDTAYSFQNNETAFYSRVLVIAEAKYWQRPLSKISANDQRDIFKNTNPSFQISSYLSGTNVDWGILTNGREWRLYYRQASSTATEFYPVDLVELLETEDIEQFKYFWLFFRSAAFAKDSYNKNFLERVRAGSTTYATQVGNELKTLVFDQIFPDLARGFIVDAMRRGKTVEPKQIYAATLSFLYKLLFLLYAEARNLLPITTAYRDYSLIKITQEIAASLDKQRTLSETSTKIYQSLLGLFEIVDRGDKALAVPRYNGGLFHFDFHEIGDREDYPENYFLSEHQISDAILFPALDKLARFEKLPIDYSFLGVRQLGSIYEGLLEYRLIIEDEKTAKVHLENDKGERKATGSYYTPDYIVKYIVSHTLKPILEERKQRFADLMTQINQLHEKMIDGRLGIQSRNGLQKDLQRLERQAKNTLLDIKICDPAMGSGHFLVEAVDYLTDELINILNEYPEHNPILEMLGKTRNSILENLQQQGINIDINLDDNQLLQRVVMKRCIYGVDLNPMAVELAKVSLWLHFFTIGAPLSFLDHHLRCGNSLIGTTAREAEANMMREESGQLSLLTGPFVGLLRAAEIMRGVSTLSDATFAEVETSERLFKEFDQAAKPFKRLLDIYVSQFFGVKQAKNFLERFGINAINAKFENMNAADIAVYEEARRLFDQKRFFHWDLEFPEVFIDLESASWKENPGFDAVIGNPPYGSTYKDYTNAKLQYISNTVISKDIYLFFIELSLDIIFQIGTIGLITPNTWMTLESGCDFRKLVLQTTQLIKIAEFRSAFQDAIVETAALIASKDVNSCKNTEVLNFANQEIITRYFRLTSEWLLNEGYVIDYYLNMEEISILNKSINQCIKLEELVNICGGTKLYQKGKGNPPQTQLVVKEKPYTSNKLLPDFEPLITGGDIQKYVTQNELIYVKYGVWLAEPRNESIFRNQKIIVRRTDDSIIASIDCDLRICQNSVHCLLKKQDSIFSDYFLLSILNSFYIKWWYQKKNFQMVGKPFAEVKVIYLSRIPVPKISFTTPAEKRQTYLENTINLYQQYQINHNPNILLSQIDHHLNQEPEQADVIHDFLAYLAEQMIELNKQKQTEIKGFLTWLARLIGTEIDNLTNKSKIQNYLGDYYKQKQADNHLTLDELIDILKKNKKKLKIDISGRKEQETLAKEYQASLNTLLPIKKQLKQCDWLIDEIVYKLYKLTPEEKAIIEGENN